MKKKIALMSLIVAMTNSSFACTTIIVGKDASADGSIFIARNVDAPNAEDYAGQYVYHAPKKGGYTVKSVQENHFSYKMPSNLLGYGAWPDPQTLESGVGGFEESGFNDAGVGISATETIFSNDRTLNVDPYNKEHGVVEEIIPSVILPQMRTAREGVQILGKLIEAYGSGEGFGVAFVDKNEAWYLENAGGHQWLAKRIPDDSYFVSANQSRLGTFDLADSENFLSSPNLVGFAKEKGLFDSRSGEEFSFRKVFGRDKVLDAEYNYPRVKSLQNKFTSSSPNRIPETNDFADFLRPDKKLALSDVRDGLRDYFVGTKSDPYTTTNPGATARPIAVYRTYQSHILQVKPKLPVAISHVEYMDFGMTALGVYVPFYAGAKIPESYRRSSHEVDDMSASWKFRKVQLLAMQDFPRYQPMVRAAYDRLEEKTGDAQKNFEEDYQTLHTTNPAAAQKLLDSFTETSVNDALAVSDQLVKAIMYDMSKEVDRKYRYHGA